MFVCPLCLYPATPGWAVRCGCVCLGSGVGSAPPLLAGVLGVCVCLCVRSACTAPLLAGVCGVGVCAWARVSAAPRHSWLGCWGSVCACVRALVVPRHSWLGCAVWACVLGLGLWLRPATPGWVVGVCVLVCAFRLYPATPGWGVRCGRVCLGSGFCAPPLLAGVRGVGVCAWARVSAAPRHSRLGCWGVCVPLCALRLYPATPGWGVRCGRVCLGSGFGCSPPLPAGVLGFCVCLCARSACTSPLLAGVCGVGVCAWARVSAAPRHSWQGCWGVRAGVRAPLVPHHSRLGCAVWVCVLGLGCRLRPATPGWGVGVLCVLVCALRLYPATHGWGVRCGCVCLGSGFGCTPPLLAWVLGCVCACVCAPLAPRHSWLGCAVWLCVLGLGFRLRPATPGWGVGVCVCLCVLSACTPPLLAGVCGVGVCAWARVSAAPRHSWLGCWGVCVLVCALRLHPATPGWGVRCGCVCLGSGFGCAPPLLAGVLGCVCACVCAPLAQRHSWLGCAVWACVLGLGFRLRPATPGWRVQCGCVCFDSGFGCAPPLLAGVLVFFVCLCVRSACTPPLLAGVCGVGVCAWARVSAAPRHSWLGCLGVCVLVCALRLHPAPPGWGVRCGCVCLGSGFGCASPLLAGVLGCVCACVSAPLAARHSWLVCAVWTCVLGLGFRLRPATPGWGVRCGCVWLGSGFGCAPPLLAGVLGFCVCLCVRSACTPPLLAGVCGVGVCAWARVLAAPRHSWLGCWAVCVLVWALVLHPATPGWGARWGCVCFGSGFGCAPPLLAGVLGCVYARVRAPLVARHSWLGCAVWVCVFGLGFRLRPATPGWGVGVCVCWCVCSSCTPPLLAWVCILGVCARARVLAAPRHSWLGFVVCGLAVAWHLFLCRGSLRVVRALRVWGPWQPSLLGTCPCALVVAGGVPLWRAWWPRVVRRAASRPIALGAPVGFPDAVVPFPGPGACAPRFTGWLRGARGGRPRTRLFVPAAGPRRGRGAGEAVPRTYGPWPGGL